MYVVASAGMVEILLLCRSRSLRLGMSVKDSHGKEVSEFPSNLSSSRLYKPRKLSTLSELSELKDIQRISRLLR